MKITYKLGEVESRFAGIVWENAPLTSHELVERCAEALNWKKSTTYTVLKKLCGRGLFVNEGGTVRALLTREEFYAAAGARFVQESYNGSLPAFVAAFAARQSLSAEDIAALRRIIDAYPEG